MLENLIGLTEKQGIFEKEMESMKREIGAMRKDLKEERKESLDRQVKVQAELEGVKKEVVEVGKDISEQKAKYLEVIRQGLSKEQLEADKGIAANKDNAMKQDREFQVRLTEAMERDKRKNNVVVMGVDEGMGDNEARKYVEEMFATIMEKEVTSLDWKGRIGRVGSKCRPIRVGIEDHVYRRTLMKKARSLRDSKEYEKIFISPDLTRKQQEDDKTLRDKLKEFRNEGIEGVKINRGSIIRMDGSNRVVLFGAGPPMQ